LDISIFGSCDHYFNINPKFLIKYIPKWIKYQLINIIADDIKHALINIDELAIYLDSKCIKDDDNCEFDQSSIEDGDNDSITKT